jgi:DNA-binding transcriptional regulator YiaG
VNSGKADKREGRKGVQAIPLDYDPYSPAEIRAIRTREGMTQAGFARCLGVSQITVLFWERGAKLPSSPAFHLIRLFDLYPELFIAQPGRSYFKHHRPRRYRHYRAGKDDNEQ